jgi:hypothetical protein
MKPDDVKVLVEKKLSSTRKTVVVDNIEILVGVTIQELLFPPVIPAP